MEESYVNWRASSPFEQAEYVRGEEGANLLRWLLSEPTFRDEAFSVFSFKVLKGLFLKRDHALFEDLLRALQGVVHNLYRRLQRPADDNEERLLEIMLGHVLTLFPFVEPKEGEHIAFPEKVDGTWRLTTFRSEWVELTPRWLGSPMVALGMIPIDGDTSSHPKLIFMGTPPPTVSGAFLSYWTNFVPGHSIGEAIFRLSGKRRVQEWLEAQDKPVDLSGISLGGSLALQTVSHFPKHVRRIQSYHSGALHKRALKAYQNEVASLTRPPEVAIFTQSGDLVSELGVHWAEGWEHYHLLPEKPLGLFASHNRAFSGRSVAVIKGKGKQRRKGFNLLYQMLSIPISCILTPILLVKAGFYTIHHFLKLKKSNL